MATDVNTAVLNLTRPHDTLGVWTSGYTMMEVVLFYIGLIFNLYLNPTLALAGILTNLINIVIFYKMGFSDGVNQNFLMLSIFDGILALGAFLNSTSYILLNTKFPQGGPIAEHLQAVIWVSLISWPFSQIFSCITTTFIAAVRCCCVAMPLHAKRVLTARRQLLIIAFFSLSVGSILVYTLAPVQYIRSSHPFTNASEIMKRGAWYALLHTFTDIFLYITFIIVILCVIILSLSLNRSHRFLNQWMLVSGDKEKRQVISQEVRVVQTVFLVAAVFLLCNTPTIIIAIARQISPELETKGKLRNLYDFFIIFTETTLLTKVVANVFIYFSFNKRYRFVFLKMVGRNSEKDTGKLQIK